MEENETNVEKEKTAEKKKSPISFLIDSIKGITLGISVAVPGLSAGTIAVAEKCYDTIIDSVTGLKKSFKRNFLILLPYVIGLLLGALAAFIGIQRGYKVAPFTLTGLFAGLVIGSLPVAIKELKKGTSIKEKSNHIIALVLCLLFAAFLGIATALIEQYASFSLAYYLNDRAIWMYFFIILVGFIGASACIVPGISGSMSLMVLGMYYPILNTYTGEEAIWHSGSSSTILTGLLLALLLVIGALLGVIFSSKGMKYLLSNHRVTTFYGILGLIIGSVISMYMNSSIYPLYLNNSIKTWDYIIGAILFVITSAGMFIFLRLKDKKNKHA